LVKQKLIADARAKKLTQKKLLAEKRAAKRKAKRDFEGYINLPP
jgi:hypothetical protein